MIRWRCRRRACRRISEKRKSTKKKFPVPRCSRCAHPMIIDHYRTSRRESRKRNCDCSAVKWAPHSHSYCQALTKLQFEISCRDSQGRFMGEGVPF